MKQGLGGLAASSLLAGLMVVVPITMASTPVSAAGGCLDKLEIETPGETATTFGAVDLAPGETFTTNIKHWTSRPTAATYLNSFNSEIRLSPMLDDGFPGYASTTQRDAFAADGPWQSDGFMNDGTFTYTNPSSSSVTSFVLEVSYWNRPASGIIGRTEASGFSTCVSPHTPPDRPTRDCVAAPTLVANGANVWSEPFELKKDAYISMRMVDERPLRYNDNGDQQPLLRNDYLIRTWLYGRSGPDDSWHYIRRDSHRSQNNWLRGSYVGSWDISMKNSSNYTEVMVIFGKWISRGYALSTPLDVSIKDPGQSWRSVCLTSTETTVTWDAAPSCATDRTARMRAQVTNKTGAAAGFRIALFDPTTGSQIHGSHDHQIDNDSTGVVQLGGIPTGTWQGRLYEQHEDGTETQIGPTITSYFNASDCSTGSSTHIDSTGSCTATGESRLAATVTNRTGTSESYLLGVFDAVTGIQVGTAPAVTIGPDSTGIVEAVGIQDGTWRAVVFADGSPSGPSVTRTLQNSDICAATEPTASWGAGVVCVDGHQRSTAQVTNNAATTRSYKIVLTHPENGDEVRAGLNQPANPGETITITTDGPNGAWRAAIHEDERPIHPVGVAAFEDAPTLRGASFAGDTFTSTWATVACASEYEWRLTGPGWEEVGTSAGGSMSVDLPTAAPDGRYCVAVKTVFADGQTDSAEVNADGSDERGCAWTLPASQNSMESPTVAGTSDSPIVDGGVVPVQNNPEGPCPSPENLDFKVTRGFDSSGEFEVALAFNVGIATGKQEIYSLTRADGVGIWNLTRRSDEPDPLRDSDGRHAVRLELTGLPDPFLFGDVYGLSLHASTLKHGLRTCHTVTTSEIATLGAPDADTLLRHYAVRTGLTDDLNAVTNPWFSGEIGEFENMKLRQPTAAKVAELSDWVNNSVGRARVSEIVEEADRLLRQQNVRYDSYLARMYPLWYILGITAPEFEEAERQYEDAVTRLGYDENSVVTMAIGTGGDALALAFGPSRAASAITTGVAVAAGAALIYQEVRNGEFLNSAQDGFELAGVLWSTGALLAGAFLGPVGTVIVAVIGAIIGLAAIFLDDASPNRIYYDDTLHIVELKRWRNHVVSLRKRSDSLSDIQERLNDQIEPSSKWCTREDRDNDHTCYSTLRKIPFWPNEDGQNNTVGLLRSYFDPVTDARYGVITYHPWRPGTSLYGDWKQHIHEIVGEPVWSNELDWDDVTNYWHPDNRDYSMRFRDVNEALRNNQAELGAYLECGAPINAYDLCES